MQWTQYNQNMVFNQQIWGNQPQQQYQMQNCNSSNWNTWQSQQQYQTMNFNNSTSNAWQTQQQQMIHNFYNSTSNAWQTQQQHCMHNYNNTRRGGIRHQSGVSQQHQLIEQMRQHQMTLMQQQAAPAPTLNYGGPSLPTSSAVQHQGPSMVPSPQQIQQQPSTRSVNNTVTPASNEKKEQEEKRKKAHEEKMKKAQEEKLKKEHEETLKKEHDTRRNWRKNRRKDWRKKRRRKLWNKTRRR